jgi:hypothetical protein
MTVPPTAPKKVAITAGAKDATGWSSNKARTVSKKVAIMAGGGVLVLAVTAWGVSSHFKTPPIQVAQVEPAKLWEEMRKPGLSDKEREELGHKMHEARQAEMDARMKDYFKASDGEKQAILDKQIDEFEKQRKEWEERRKQEEERRAAAGEKPDDGPTSRPAHDWRQQQSTPEERKARSESRDPDKMAKQMAYFAALQARMKERGIQMPFGPGRGGPGGRGPGGPGGGGGHRGGGGPH